MKRIEKSEKWPTLKIVFHKNYVAATLKTLPKAFNIEISDEDFRKLNGYIRLGKRIEISNEILGEIKLQEKLEREVKEIHRKLRIR